MKRRFLAIVMCVLMTAAMIPSFAFAETTAPAKSVQFHYVALGDAATLGYGMHKNAGYNILTAGTYPAVLTETLASKGFDVKTRQLGMKGMRTEELRFLLDGSYSGDAYTKENFPDLAIRKSEYRNAVANADLVTYGLGTVNFGSYLLYVAQDVDKRCDDPAIKALASADSEGIKASLRNEIDDLLDAVPSVARSKVKEMVDQYSDSYIEAAAYVYYSFCKSYDESVSMIHAINPDADIVVLGVDNMLGGLTIELVGATIGIGDLYNKHVVTRVNNHLQSSGEIYGFVQTTGVSRFINEAASYDKNTAHITQQFKDYCDIYEDDLLLKTQLNKTLASYSADKKTKGFTAAYNTVAQSMKSVASINYEKFELADLSPFIGDKKEEYMNKVSTLGKDLMKGLKNKSIEFAKLWAENKAYTSKLNSFVSSALYGSDLKLRKFAHVIMAFGMRTAMGEAFFQQPTGAGHKEIATRIWNAYKDKKIHCNAAEPTCERQGVASEYWLTVSDAKLYLDEGCTQEAAIGKLLSDPLGHDFEEVAGTSVAATCTKAGRQNSHKCKRCEYTVEGAATKPLGHSYGKEVVTVKAGVGKDGRKEKKCVRCGNVVRTVIPGKGPANTKIKKFKRAKKSFTVIWKLPTKANLKNTTGYQIRYSLKSSMAKSKTVTISKNKTKSKKIKGLKAKKKYYVQIRTYKKAGGKNYYSAWSSKKKVKTK